MGGRCEGVGSTVLCIGRGFSFILSACYLLVVIEIKKQSLLHSVQAGKQAILECCGGGGGGIMGAIAGSCAGH